MNLISLIYKIEDSYRKQFNVDGEPVLIEVYDATFGGEENRGKLTN